MQALTYRGPSRVRIEKKPDPVIEHPQDIILKVTRAAICGSDLHLYHGLVADMRVGCTFGHEFTGVVVDAGKSVRTMKAGDRVVVPFNIGCGRCYFCKRSLTASCDSTNPNSSVAGGVYGYSHTTGGYDGGQAEYVRVPFADFNPMKIPDDMDDESVLFLSDILPTGYQAAEMGHIQVGETVVVFGAGPVGLFAMRSAWLMGAGRVIAVDLQDYRLEKAKQFAQVETVNYRSVKNVVAWIKNQTEGRGADVCIDAVGMEASGSFGHNFLGKIAGLEAGAPTAAVWAIDACRKGGNVVLIGVYGPPYNMLNIGTAMNKGLTMRMAQCSVKRYMPHLLEHIRAGRIDAKSIISHRLPLEAAPEAYEMFANKRDDCVKCVLIPDSASSQELH